MKSMGVILGTGLLLAACSDIREAGRKSIPLTGAQDADSPEAIAVMNYKWCGDAELNDNNQIFAVIQEYQFDVGGELVRSYFYKLEDGSRGDLYVFQEGRWGLDGSRLAFEVNNDRSEGRIEIEYESNCTQPGVCRDVPSQLKFFDDETEGVSIDFEDC